MATAVVILAAGQGTRMNSDRPKVLHEVAGAPLLHHVMRTARALEPERMIVVTGHGAADVERAARALEPEVTIAHQPEQLGTGDAVHRAREALESFSGDLLVLYGDTPFLSEETLRTIVARREGGADIVVVGFEAADPGRYGRLVLAEDGSLARIVEAKDATAEELAIRLCNSGILAGDAQTLLKLVDGLENANASGEYYLTDVVAAGRAKGLSAEVVTCPEAETLGVNSRRDLAAAEAAFQARKRTEVMANGATLVAPETVFFAHDTWIGRDVVIEANVVFGPGVTVESGATIRAFSHLEGAHVSQGAVVGPYARLRPGAEIGDFARVGNFVEVKEAQIGEGAKVNHLSYMGDASVGAGANIGAGTITCNYDGVFKHRTEIGPRAFIGSNTALVAPVRVGAEAMTGSGSVITRDVPDGALAVARAAQQNKPGLARRLMERLRAAKARKAGN